MASESIGGVDISVNVDLSGLEEKFQAAVSEAGADGQKIGQAIADGISSGAETGAAAFDAAMKTLVEGGASANEAFQKLTGSTQTFMEALQSGAMNDFADNFGKIASEAQAAAPAIEQVASAAKDASAALGQMSQSGSGGFNLGDMFAGAKEGISSVTSTLGQLDQATAVSTADFGALGNSIATMGGIALGIGGIKALISDMESVTDSVNRAQISLTALTGSADQASGMLAGLSQLGMSDGLSMPGLRQAAISMEALLPAGTDIVGVLSHVADAAAVMGTSVEATAMKLDRMVESGMLSARMIVGLGINLDDIKTSMENLGATSDDLAGGLTKAFKALDPEGRLMVVTDALQKFQGVAEDVANNTFGGLWQQAVNTFETDMAAMGQSVLPLVQQALPSIREAIDETFADLSRIKEAVQVTVDAIVGIFIALPAAVAGAMKMAADAATGNWALVASDAEGTAGQLKTIWAGTMKEINSDVAAGAQAISDTLSHGVTIDLSARLGDAAAQTKAAMADMANSVGATVVTVSGKVDTLAGHFTNVGKSAAISFAQAEAAVQSFDAKALSGSGTVGTLQAAFENASKAITMVAKEDLPAAIKAVADYNQTMVDAGAKASVLDAGFLEQSKLVGQLAKTDLPGAVASMAALTKVYLDGNAPIALVNAAFNATEKAINSLAKDGYQPAIDAQKAYNAVLLDSKAPMDLIVSGLENEQKLFDQMSKTNLQGAIDGLKGLTQEEQAAGVPAQILTDTFKDLQGKLNQLSQTDAPAAIGQLIGLAQSEKDANQPLQVWVGTLTDAQKVLQTFAQTDLKDAATGMGILAQAEIAMNAPADVVNKTFDAQVKLFQQLGSTNLRAAADGLNGVIQAEIAAKEPVEQLDIAFQAQQGIFDKMATGGNFTAAIAGLKELAQVEHDFAPTGTEFVKTLQDEQRVFDQMAGTNLQGAIDGLKGLVDQEVALNAPAQIVTATLDDERNKIVALGGRDVPAAVAQIADLIQKQKELKQPTDDVNASIKVQSDLLQKEVNTDIPAAIAGHQKYLDELKSENELYKAINAAGVQTIQQQQFQVASLQQLLAEAKDINLAYGDRLKIEAQIQQAEINLGTAQGQNVEAQIWGLEKIKLQQEALVISTHGWADSETQALNDAIKGFEQMGGAIANVIVNGGKMGDALVKEFKKIAVTILTDLIDGALKQLAAALITAVTGVQTTFTTMSAGIGGVGAAASAAASGLTALGSAATAAATAISAAATAQASSSTAVAAAAGGEAAAMAAEVGADTAATAATIADTSATVADTAAAVADAAATGGEAAAMIAETGAVVADTGATIADTGATIADTGATIADAAASIADTGAKAADAVATVADTAATVAQTVAEIAETVATIADTVAQIAFASVVSAIAGIVGAIAGIVGDVYLAAIDTKLFHIETTELEIRNETQNRRKDAWDQYNHTYDRIGELINLSQSIDDTLKQILAVGPGGSGGGGLNESQAHNLQSLSDAIAPMMVDLNDIDTRVGNIDSGVHALDTDLNSSFTTLDQLIYVVIAKLDGVISAINYHGSSQSQSMQSEALSLQSLAAGQAPSGHAIVGAINDQTGRLVTAAQGELAASQAQVAAALTLNDEIAALQREIQADKNLEADAIRSGDFTLAQQYADAAAAAGRQLQQLESSTNAGFAQVTTSMSNTTQAITDSAGRVIVGASQDTSFVITAVDRNASVISNAISGVAGAVAGAVGAAMAGFTGGSMPYTPGRGNMQTGPGSGGSTSAVGNPYDPGMYNPPWTGGPAGGSGTGPLGPYKPGQDFTNVAPGVVARPLPPEAYTGFNAPPPPASAVVNPSTGTPVESGPKPEAPITATGPKPESPSTGPAPPAPPTFSAADQQYINQAVAAAIGSGLAPMSALQAALTSAMSTGLATPAQIEILRQEIEAAAAGAHQTYTSTGGSTSISGTIPGSVPMGTNQGAAAPSTADVLAKAIANETAIINELKSQAVDLNNQIVAAVAAGDQASVAKLQTSLQGVNSSLSGANSLLSQIQSTQAITGPAIINGLSGVHATTEQMAQAQKNAQTTVANLSAQLGDLNQQLIVAEASGNQSLVTSIETQIGTTNSQLSSANTLLAQINLDVLAGTVTATHVADNTALTADTIKQAKDNETAIIAGLATKLSTLNTELINALAVGDQALVTTIEGEISGVNSQLSTANGILKQIGGSTAATASNTAKAAPSNTPPSGVGPGSLIGNVAYSGMPLGYGYNDYVPNVTPHFAEGGIMPWTGMAHLEAGEMALPPDVSAMLRRMASTPDMSFSPRNPAASSAVAPGAVNIGNVTFNVYGGNAADNVRQISAYMKVVSPKLAALSS